MSLETESELVGLNEVYVQPLAAAVDIKNSTDLDELRLRQGDALKAWDEAFVEDSASPQTAALRQEVYLIQGRIYDLENPTPEDCKQIQSGRSPELHMSSTKEITLADFCKKAISEVRTQIFSVRIVSAFATVGRKRQRQL